MDMDVQDAAKLRVALERRLKELAIDNEEWLERDRRSVAFGRWLARLSATAPGAWVLAGGFAIDCLSLRPRTARELEIEWRTENAEEFVEAAERAAAHDAGDFFEFEIEEGAKYAGGKGTRYSYLVRALLAGKPIETFSFTQSLRFGSIGTQSVWVDDLLGFLGIHTREIDALLSEVLLAERLHSYLWSARAGFGRSSAEALFDLKSIAELPGLDAVRTVLAAFWIFRMHSEEIPASLPEPLEEWAEAYQVLAEPTGASVELDDGYADIAALLEPILSGEVERGTWNPGERCWMVS